LRDRLARNFEIFDGETSFKFRCETLREIGRYYNFFLKEPGTCQWLRKDLQAGQVFYDIGANVGVYTLQAAKRVGKQGRVFAFEPHSANFTRLIENIIINHFQDIVVPCNFALNDESGFLPFNYSSNKTGTSDSQLSSVRGFNGAEYTPQLAEMKYALTIDALIGSGRFPAPHHVKIDVDGNEGLILRGMEGLLRGAHRPASVQVEINPHTRQDILAFMESCNFILSEQHMTRGVADRVAKGGKAEDFHFNGIFRPRP
jgi:FkbM family methyltransferase